MSDAHQRIGTMVAKLLGELEDTYGNEAEILDALIAVEVMPEDPDPQAGSIIEHRCTTRRLTVALGLIDGTHDSLLEPYGRGDDETEDE